MDVIFSAAYSLMEKAYFMFDEDKNKNIIVKIEQKKKAADIKSEFMQELLNYAVYKKNFEKTKNIREYILKRALLLVNDEKDENRNKN